jgi:UV DNA damage endonuclease
MGLPQSAKIQIHVGGTYGQKEQSLARFVERYRDLDIAMRQRLVIENDDRNYTTDDCLAIHRETGTPVLFDVYHHALHQSGRAFSDTLRDVSMTWQPRDGLPMVDYSSYSRNEQTIRHMQSLDRSDFQSFLVMTQPYDFDVMLEIKNKETSALQAVKIAEQDCRFYQGTT